MRVVLSDGTDVEVTTPVAEPGPLIAMKLQAVMDRGVEKQGTDLLDIVRLTFDEMTRAGALAQIGGAGDALARDVVQHVDLWFVRRQRDTLRRIRQAGGDDVEADDLTLVAELLLAAARRPGLPSD